MLLRLISILSTMALGAVSLFAQTLSEGGCKYSVNADGETVTLIEVSRGRDSKTTLYLDDKVTNTYNKKMCTITELGDGTHSLSQWTVMPVKITSNIIRINNSSFTPVEPTYYSELLMDNATGVEYIGDDCASQFTNLTLNSGMEIGATGAKAVNLMFGEGVPTAVHPDEGMFTSIDTIRCTTTVPPDVNFVLSASASQFETPVIVPDEAKAAYKAHAYWKQFVNLRTVTELKNEIDAYNARQIYTETPDGAAKLHYIINDDNATVTLVNVISLVSGSTKVVDLTQPVVGADGKSYKVVAVGNGTEEVGSNCTLIFGPDVAAINANSQLRVFSLPANNSVKYFGANVFATVPRELYISDGARFEASPRTPYGYEYTGYHYVCIGNDVTFSSENSSVFGTGARIVRCESATPPTLDIPLFSSDDAYAAGNISLYVPAGSISAYRNDPEWGRIESIFEYSEALPAVETGAYDFGNGDTFTVNRNVTGGREIKTLRVNPDGKSVTLIDYTAPSTAKRAMDWDLPVTDPSTGKAYTINALGDGAKSLDGLPVNISIPENVTRINDYALKGIHNISFSSANKISFIGLNAFSSDLNGVDSLFIAAGATVAGPCTFPDYVRIDNGASLGLPDKSTKAFFDYYDSYYNADLIRTSPVIECKTTMPPVIFGILFPDKLIRLYSEATLIVPKGCVDAYRDAYEWGYIANIKESDTMSGINEAVADASDFEVQAAAGAIVIEGSRDASVAIYGIDGSMVKSGRVQPGINEISVAPGFYIVRIANNFACKVAVR